tara:strand:+ start:1661 stop:2731 length:1071 start_codon:yes stop_codon:yes gene_type:complete
MKSKITDDFELLDKIIAASKEEHPDFPVDGPTYEYFMKFLEDIRSKGLQKMVSEGSRLLNTIGGVSYSPLQQVEYNITRQCENGYVNEEEKRILISAAKIAFEKDHLPLLPYEISFSDLNESSYNIAKISGSLVGAGDLRDASVAEELDSGYNFDIEGRKYNYLHLYYYLRYVFAASKVNFDEIDTYIEIGSGSGRFVEIIKKLHPHLTVHLFDVGPQLYVAHRYLNAVMPDQLCEFDVKEHQKGMIHFHPHAEISHFEPTGRVFSCGMMVYCIMPPKTAKAYLDILRSFSEWIYICEPMGQGGGGTYGIKDPVVKSHYEDFLKPTHDCLLQQEVGRPLAKIQLWDGVGEMLWRKR